MGQEEQNYAGCAGPLRRTMSARQRASGRGPRRDRVRGAVRVFGLKWIGAVVKAVPAEHRQRVGRGHRGR
eukprot:11166987-Lingulodinium_polyedra.AAC.1